jgi:MoaA/NifB/PqqE/SkfB family radical SAM enzyme
LPYKPFIGITGGEPFMKRDIIEVFNYLKKKNFKFSITTNFSIPTKKQISDLIDSGIQDLRVSIDGPEDIHNKIRGVNIFKRVIDNLKFVRSHKKGKDLPIKLNCTISRANMHHIQELIGIASELKADLSYQFLEFVDDKHFHAHSKVSISKLGAYYPTKVDRGTLNKEETETIITQLNKAKKLAEEKGVKLLFTPDITDNNEIREYHLNINYLHTDACKFPWGAARINSYGDVFPCIDYIYGNLRKSSFSKVWNNKRARYFRRTLKKSKLFPGCIRCCKI